MNGKIVVWDICGGINGSVRMALNLQKYDIYTFDKLSETKSGIKNIIIDLTNDINLLIPIFKKYPFPEVILISPPCQSFSMAATGKGGNASYVVNENGSITDRPDWHYGNKNIIKRNYDLVGIKDRRKTGKKIIENSLKIIKIFEPKYWYIENPERSLIWNFIKHNHDDIISGIIYKNITYYNNYGTPYKKPTIFMSNVNLHLKNVNIKAKLSFEYVSKRNNRSDIPSELIREIFNSFLNNI